jgi:hypothetical protein
MDEARGFLSPDGDDAQGDDGQLFPGREPLPAGGGGVDAEQGVGISESWRRPAAAGNADRLSRLMKLLHDSPDARAVLAW